MIWRGFVIFATMAKDKIDKATAIKSILSDLKKGIEKEAILLKIVKKCEKSQMTVYRWYNEAEKQYQDYLSRINPVKEKAEEEAVYEATKENIKDGILSKSQALKILSDLARKAERDSDKVNALKTMADLEGWKAPSKTELSGSLKTDAPPTIIFVDSDHDDD